MRFFQPQPPGFDMCVVLNADCDLVQKKNQGCLVILPVYTANQFYRNIIIPSALTVKRKECIDLIKETLRNAYKKNEPNAKLPSTAATKDLIDQDDSIFDKFSRTIDQKHRKILENLREIWKILNENDSKSHITLFKSEKIKNKNISKKSFIGKLFSSAYKEPDDIIRLGPLEGSSEYLHFVYLRQTMILLELDVDTCFEPTSEPQSVAIRVCALKDPIRYHVASRFGQFYSRVGIPKELEAERDTAVALLEEEITNDLENT